MLNLKLLREKLSAVYLAICLMSFLFLDLSFRYIFAHVFMDGMYNLNAVLFTIIWSILFTAFTALLPGLLKRIFMMALITIFGVLCIAHGALYGIFQNFFSFADVMYAGDGAKFFSFSYLSIRKLQYFSVFFSVGLMGVAAWAAPWKRSNRKRSSLSISFFTLIAAAILLFTMHHQLISNGSKQQMSWASALNDQSDSALYIDFTNVNQSMGITGLYQYTARSLVVSTGLEQWLQTSSTHKRLDEAYRARLASEPDQDNAMTGRFVGKNVMMIMMESIDTWMLTEDYMPNLYSVQQDSIQFVHHYSPSFVTAATFNSEFMALTGLIPPTAGVRQSAYTTNDFSWSLPNLFKNAGYRADSFHSADAVIYNRGAIHQNIGFSTYNSHYQMGMKDPKMDSQMIGGYARMTASEPFFDFIITYSGHGPYTDELGSISAPHFEKAAAAANANGVTGSEDNLLEYCHAVAHAMETDAFIGALVAKLESDGRLDDTVLIFFADHYSKYFSDNSFVMDIKNVENADLLTNTPFFIYSKDADPAVMTKYTSTIDIYPTMVNLFGLNANMAYFVGNDTFGADGNYVMFRNYAWYDGETYYSAEYQGEITAEIAARNAEVKERVNLSWDTMTSDYFRYLLNVDAKTAAKP